MNIDKAKILLDKINVLMKSMSLSPDQVTAIEKDLMKSYVSQLYEIFLVEDGSAAPAPKPVKATPPPPPAPEPIPEPVVAAKPVAPKPTPPPAPAPEPPAPEPTPEPVKAAKPAPKPVELEITPPPPPPPKPKVSVAMDSDLEEVFNLPEATDFAEKLSQSPIKDLTKAFSINDRLLSVQELFNGDNDLFNATLKKLNTFDSFDEAKTYLASSIASKNKWASKGKKGKAKTFIKTVRRRYT